MIEDPPHIDLSTGLVGVGGGASETLMIQGGDDAVSRPVTWAPPFQPGQSGNPAGRPKGSRVRLGEVFVKMLLDDFKKNGLAALESVRVNDPSTYIRVIASLLPKEITAEDGMSLITNIQVTFVEPVSRG